MWLLLSNYSDNFDVNWSSYRSKTIYTITKPPKYGIFLTVHGEQEVSSFSQRDIDEKNIYFIPTNYSAYQVILYFISFTSLIKCCNSCANYAITLLKYEYICCILDHFKIYSSQTAENKIVNSCLIGKYLSFKVISSL